MFFSIDVPVVAVGFSKEVTAFLWVFSALFMSYFVLPMIRNTYKEFKKFGIQRDALLITLWVATFVVIATSLVWILFCIFQAVELVL